jgi:xanthine dehydrogenase molybdopterin-binding subunit B
MCLAVGKLSEDEDVVITGSKDHYIKVKVLVCHILGVTAVLLNISFHAH